MNINKHKKTVSNNKIKGTKEKPRLVVFRSNKSIYVQLIDDGIGKVLLGLSEKHIEDKKGTKTEKAKVLGLTLAAKAVERNIKHVVFDKRKYKYHGRVKAIAEGAREGGLIF